MKPPYQLCMIGDCSHIADRHHEPEKSLQSIEDYCPDKGIDNPKYHRPLCRHHHDIRHHEGYRIFKERYPEYTGISMQEYRAEKRGGR